MLIIKKLFFIIIYFFIMEKRIPIKKKLETKLEKLTCFRITIVFLCEVLFEFSFGIVFFILTNGQSYYMEKCADLFW